MYRATNNAVTTLASAVTSSATSIQVAPGTGALLPVIEAPDYTMLTISLGGAREIVRVTARANGSDSLTVVRAQEGTVAQAWTSAASVECRLTAGVMESKLGVDELDELPAKGTPVNADALVLIDSEAAFAPRLLTWAGLKAALGTLFAGRGENSDITGLTGLTTALSISQGGTGATTASGARASLGLAIGTDVQAFNANTAVLNQPQTYTAAQRGAVVPAAFSDVVTLDFASGNHFNIEASSNFTLANPVNAAPGQSGYVFITHTQRLISFGTAWKFTGGVKPQLSRGGTNSVDRLDYVVRSATEIHASVSRSYA